MAKKRLNKKVVLVSSAVFAILGVILILAILYKSRDPEKFIRDGDAALKVALEAADAQKKLQEYKKAEHNYHKARLRMKDDSLKIDVLFKLVDLYIQMDMYAEEDQWRFALGCWNQIIMTDPENIKARYARLNYFYIMADSGVYQVWQEVCEQASQLIEMATSANLLTTNPSKWKTAGMPEVKISEQQLGPYLYLVRGRSNLELAKRGGVLDPDKLIEQATNDLEKVLEFEKYNIDVYLYLAHAALQKGENLAKKGNFEERDKAIEKAKEILGQAINAAPDNAEAHINLLTLKLASTKSISKEQIQSLEPEYLSLVDKFPSNATVLSAISLFYSDLRLGPEYLDKATKAAEEAVKLDKENVIYAILAANLHYRMFCHYGQKAELYKAIEIAKNALTLPNAQEKSGPRNWANKINKVSLYSFLANCYIEQIISPCEARSDAETAVLLKNAEQAVYEIEQIFGSGEDPRITKWQGMLELAKGNKDVAVRKLYAAYEQLKASAQSDAQLSYTLANIFKNTSEIGAVTEFLISALNANIAMIKPEARLDYIDILLKLKMWTAAISNINVFEEIYGPNERNQTLRIKAYIGANQFDEAEEELAKLGPDDANAIKLKLALVQARSEQILRSMAQKKIQESQGLIFSPGAEKDTNEPEISGQLMAKELDNYNQLATELVRKLLTIEPNFVERAYVSGICRYYIKQGQINEAKDLVNQFLQYFPDDTTALVYKQILSEPEPENVSQQRQREIEEQVLTNINDPIQQAVRLGVFYLSNNQKDKAAAEFQKVLKIKSSLKSVPVVSLFEQLKEESIRPFAADQLLEIVLGMKDWTQAEQIIEMAQRENFDGCQGLVFVARLDMAKGNFKDALAKLDESLKQRQVFSRIYMLRSSVNAALGNDHASISDIRKAASLNPLDGAIAKVLAISLYNRDQKLADNVTPEQTLETRTALDAALSLNTSDFQLLSFYADYISQVEPFRALAIRQNLQKVEPSMHNATRLGQLATKLAIEETNAERKKVLFAIAVSSFEQAKEINPQDQEMLSSYANYFTAIGQDDKAKQLLQDSGIQGLLWGHYFQQGNFEQAKKLLEQLYESNKKDVNVIKGLLVIASKTSDKEATKKYAEELLAIQDNAENHLIQIQTFLRAGLVKEAELNLQSFKEKYPDEPKAMLLEAWLAMRQGQLERALKLTNQVLESNQNDETSWRLRGEINLLMANYEQAINDLKRSKLLSDEPDTRISLAKAYLKMGREDDAITELKNMIDRPDAPIEGRILLEQIYLRLGRKEALRKLYDETIEKFPNDASWCNRAGAFAIANGNFNKAEELFKKTYLLKCQEYYGPDAKGKTPDEQFAMAFDGYLQSLILAAGNPDSKDRAWKPENLDKVFEEGRKYIDGVLAPIAYLRMAEAKLKLGDKKTTTEYCRKAVDEAGTNEMLASDILLRMFLLLGPEEVSKYCKQKIETTPDSLAANWTMFNLSKINAEYGKAISYIDKCIEIAGSDTTGRVNYTVNKAEILTIAYEKTSDNNYLTQAIAVYESLLDKMPNNSSVLNNLAYMLAKNNERLSDALDYAKKAVEASPNKADFLDTYGYTLYKNGNFSQADEILATALQQYEQDEILAPPEIYEHIGMVKEELGAKEQALAAYKQALEIGADKLSNEASKRIKSAIERLSK